MKTVLVVAAHPDDEVLGCGATMARLAREGWSVHVLILAEGETSRQAARDSSKAGSLIRSLRAQAEQAARIIGVKSIRFGDFPDNRMDSVDLLDVVKRIEIEIEQIKPQRLMTHRRGDVNVDHNIVHEAALAAARPLPGCSIREIWYFEVASSTEWRPPSSSAVFSPQLFVDISRTLETKLQALRAYESEMRAFPHPRSIDAAKHLAHWRGACAGFTAAEAFEIGWINFPATELCEP